MTYELYIGDRTFSSWSLRGWLMLERFGLPFNTNVVGLFAGTHREQLAHIAPARTVPAMQTPQGHVLSDSLAIAETLHEENPSAGIYPSDPAARALARNLAAEMHSGFGALRGDCPMMISRVWEGFVPSEAVLVDLARIEYLWGLARERHGAGGPWLFGQYSVVDAFYAPVAMRVTAYDLPVGDAAKTYVQTHLSDPAFLKWHADSQSESYDPWPYPLELPHRPWPTQEA